MTEMLVTLHHLRLNPTKTLIVLLWHIIILRNVCIL